jgi:hypothetical protein
MRFVIHRASDRGHIGIFYAFKMPKTHWGWCQIRIYPKIFLGENDPPDAFYPPYYASKCILCTLTVKLNFFLHQPKSMKGSQIHLALAHWKWHTPRVEKLSDALHSLFTGFEGIAQPAAQPPPPGLYPQLDVPPANGTAPTQGKHLFGMVYCGVVQHGCSPITNFFKGTIIWIRCGLFGTFFREE